MRDAILNIKSLLSGESVMYGEVDGYLRNVSTQPTPVYMTAAGPKMLELAGEIADGVMAMVGLDPRIIAAATEHLSIGAARAGRNLKDIPVVFITHLAIDKDQDKAQSWPQRYLAPKKPWLSYPSKSHHYWLRQIGIDLPDSIDPTTISTKLSHQICDALGLFGTPEYCHIMSQAQKAGFVDMAKYLADPDFEFVPIDKKSSLLAKISAQIADAGTSIIPPIFK